MKKLFLAYKNNDYEPFAYILAENEELAKQKALEIATQKYEYYKSKNIPIHENPKIKDISVFHPKDDVYEV